MKKINNNYNNNNKTRRLQSILDVVNTTGNGQNDPSTAGLACAAKPHATSSFGYDIAVVVYRRADETGVRKFRFGRVGAKSNRVRVTVTSRVLRGGYYAVRSSPSGKRAVEKVGKRVRSFGHTSLFVRGTAFEHATDAKTTTTLPTRFRRERLRARAWARDRYTVRS